MPNETEEQQTTNEEQNSQEGSQPTEPPSGQNQEAQSEGPSPEELAQQYIADQINAYYGQQGMPNQNPAYQGYQQPQTAQNYQPTQQQVEHNPDLWYTDPATAEKNLRQQLASAVQQYVNQQAQPLLQNNTEIAKSLSQQDPKLKDTWDKYGKEIEQLVNSPQITPQYRASKAVWDQAANIIRAKHLDELVDERARTLATEMHDTTEGGSGRGGAKMTGPENEALDRIRESEYGKDLIRKYGERGVLRTVEKTGMTLDQYATIVEKTHVTRHPDKPDEWKNTTLTDGES